MKREIKIERIKEIEGKRDIKRLKIERMEEELRWIEK